MSEAPERPAVARQFIVDNEEVFRTGTHGAREGDTVLVTGGLYQDALRRYEAERALNAELVTLLRRAIPHVEDNLADRDGFLSSKNTAYVCEMRAALARAEAREKGEG